MEDPKEKHSNLCKWGIEYFEMVYKHVKLICTTNFLHNKASYVRND